MGRYKFVGRDHYWRVIQILVNGLQERAMHMISFESKLLKADVIMLSFAVFSVWDNFERGLKKLLMVSEMLPSLHCAMHSPYIVFNF